MEQFSVVSIITGVWYLLNIIYNTQRYHNKICNINEYMQCAYCSI